MCKPAAISAFLACLTLPLVPASAGEGDECVAAILHAFNDARSEYEATLDVARRELDDAFNDATGEFDDAQRTYEAALNDALGDARSELDDAKRELDDAQHAYEAASREHDDCLFCDGFLRASDALAVAQARWLRAYDAVKHHARASRKRTIRNYEAAKDHARAGREFGAAMHDFDDALQNVAAAFGEYAAAMHGFDDAFRKYDDAIAAAQSAARREHEVARDHAFDDALDNTQRELDDARREYEAASDAASDASIAALRTYDAFDHAFDDDYFAAQWRGDHRQTMVAEFAIIDAVREYAGANGNAGREYLAARDHAVREYRAALEAAIDNVQAARIADARAITDALDAAEDDAHLDDDAFFTALNARLDNALPCLAE